MLSKSLLLIALTLFMISCSKDEGTPVLLYSNNFDDVSDLSAYTIGFGDIEISKEEKINNIFKPPFIYTCGTKSRIVRVF